MRDCLVRSEENAEEYGNGSQEPPLPWGGVRASEPEAFPQPSEIQTLLERVHSQPAE